MTHSHHCLADNGGMDSARSWAVAAACAWINFFTFAVVRSAAVVFASLLQTFPVTREQASWPVNLTVVCVFFSGTIAGVLARHIAIWKLNLFGCIGGSLAVAACFFAPSILFLNLFLGVIQGTCIGLLNLFNVVINQHFRKYRAMASGICNAGFTVGGLVFPPVLQALEEGYGIRGAFLICGAGMLNSVAGTFLQRTPPQAEPKEAPGRNPCKETNATSNDSLESGTEKFRDRELNETRWANLLRTHDSATSYGGGSSPGLCYHKVELLTTKPHDTGGSTEIKHEREETPHVCQVDSSRPRTKGCAQGKTNDQPIIEDDFVQRSLNEDSTDPKKFTFLSFLLLPKFYFIAFCFSIIHFNMTTYLTVVVDFEEDRGISRWKAVYLITVYAVADLLARLSSGWITDRKYLRKSAMMGSHFVLWGASLYLTPVCSSYPYQVALSVLSGWCTGSTLILIPVLLMELVSIETFGICFGISTSFVGLVGLARPLLIGLFRDTRGDYEGLFSLIGGVTVGISIPWLYPCVGQKCSSRNGSLINFSRLRSMRSSRK
ncbi:monocarboxylate transporter 12-like isoform X1 [Amblyomma americanum]